MRKSNPHFSLPGLIITGLFLAILGLFVWRTGGQAFSPGGLNGQDHPDQQSGGFASHKDFERECRRCHLPLSATQDQLCLECHTKVAEQINSGKGTHSLVENVSQCYRCHSEHMGEGASLLNPAITQFDHSKTSFSLVWHQVDYTAAPMTCAACHNLDNQFALEQSRCTSCHALEDAGFMLQHALDFGDNCLGCHDGVDRMANFDHQQTDFSLQGKHEEISCAECHRKSTTDSSVLQINFDGTPTDCNSCHAAPDNHGELASQDCAECHTSDSWKPAVWEGSAFDHSTNAGFSLNLHQVDRRGQPVACSDCHQPDLQASVLPTCIECHQLDKLGGAFIQEHQNQFGENCLECHDGIDRMSNFDHTNFFVLDGAHSQIECQDCHANQVFRGTPTECYRCHAEPEIHAGFFGLECQDCHTTQAWSPAQLHNHSFPLDHGEEGLVACQTCHPANYVEYTCYGCHEHEPGRIQEKHSEENISQNELANCTKCHPDGREEESEDH